MKVKRIDSSDTNVSKYVFDFGNAVAEAVLYKYPTYEDRTVICCSTQSGCPMGCRFCGAGDSFVRSLSGKEIVSQIQYLFNDKNINTNKIKKCQIMFMSMGEPLLNFNGLSEALKELYILYPRFSLLISTSAPDVNYERIRDLSVNIPTIGLQFSVHESTNEARDLLIPFKNKLNLQQIAKEGELWHKATGRQPFFNYCAKENNTSNLDALRLIELFDPSIWNATISVVCERDESVSAANARQRQLATNFSNILVEHGFSTRCFDPAGQDDIGGGCGQLWFVQDWMRNNSKFVRHSIGNGLPVVHPPF